MGFEARQVLTKIRAEKKQVAKLQASSYYVAGLVHFIKLSDLEKKLFNSIYKNVYEFLSCDAM